MSEDKKDRVRKLLEVISETTAQNRESEPGTAPKYTTSQSITNSNANVQISGSYNTVKK